MIFKIIRRLPALLIPLFLICSCSSRIVNQGIAKNNTVDKKASRETKALFYNLKRTAGKGFLFGQQDASMYGVGWTGDSDRSDVKSVTGSHPALFGWDLEGVAKDDSEANLSKNAERIRKLCIEAYLKGGVNTLSWHMQNFVTGKNFYDTTRCVTAILPGGANHESFVKALDHIADFIGSLKTKNGQAVPVIFRPFHEHTGNWFWWGKPFCSTDEFKALWQFTIHYFRDKKQLHNVLYAYSPDRISGNFDNYLERYPGDNYVDVLGYDDYWEFKDIKDTTSMKLGVKALAQIASYAISKNKVAALTETGLEKIPENVWFTTLLKMIKSDPMASKISYLMVWRNAHTGHFYAPYPGHSSVPDFLNFFNDPQTLFLNDIQHTFYQTAK
ncbi:MAG: beta-mannosidase [Pedobacter sp.]|jgi:mannan endo-1,4-beta-mannosidase|nr:beta-mannosidase [Pedobacter sp.]